MDSDDDFEAVIEFLRTIAELAARSLALEQYFYEAVAKVPADIWERVVQQTPAWFDQYFQNPLELYLKVMAYPQPQAPLKRAQFVVPYTLQLFANNENTEHTRPAMRENSHTDRLLDLVRQKGIVRPADLDVQDIPRVYLTRLTASGKLEKAGRGLYRLPEGVVSEDETLALVAARVPQAVFCLLTALQFHELTTQLPRQIWIALPKGSHAPRIGYPPIKLVQYSGAAFTDGVETHRRDQVELRVYSIAKTVADCFKHRNKIGLDVALEALRDARRMKKASADDLWRYAKICRVANVMRPYLEAIE